MTSAEPSLSRPTFGDWLSVVGLAAIWGASFMGVAVALQGYGPMTIAAARIAMGAVALSLVAWAMGLRFPTVRGAAKRRMWLHVPGMAALSNALPFSLLAWCNNMSPQVLQGSPRPSCPWCRGSRGCLHFTVACRWPGWSIWASAPRRLPRSCWYGWCAAPGLPSRPRPLIRFPSGRGFRHGVSGRSAAAAISGRFGPDPCRAGHQPGAGLASSALNAPET